MENVVVLPATADRFDDVAAILAPARPETPACWCLSYRLTSGEYSRLRGQERPDRLRSLTERDVAPGILVYVDDVVAGWCAFGPRTEMGRLQRSRTIQAIDDVDVWSIVCFVIKAEYRRQGLAHHLLRGVIAYAAEHGAPTLEAYPIDNAGQRVSSAFAFVGTVSLFESEGFSRVEPTMARSGGITRWIMRLPTPTALERP